MTLVFVSVVVLLLLVAFGVTAFRHMKKWVVFEDTIAVTVDKHGFFKRLLPAGRHILHASERVDFVIETKTRLTASQAATIATSDGVFVNINWSGIYNLQPDLITDKVSQRLRGLSNADRAIARNVDICLRKLVGGYGVSHLFKPNVRERIERQLSQLVAGQLKPLGIVLLNLNLQVIELPREVAEALNKAKAIEALDGAIRQLDPTTREVVKGAYQLDEILHWDAYLPTPSRLAMKRMEAMAH